MNTKLRKYIKDATALVPLDDAASIMGSKRRLAKLLGCANQTFTRFETRQQDKGLMSPLLTMRWNAASEWARMQRGAGWQAYLNEIVDEA